MPFINDMLDGRRLQQAGQQGEASNTPVSTAPSRLGASRFVFDPAQVMQQLRRRILGQEPVLNAMESMLKVLKTDLADPQRPLFVALLVGPTGVGKTELVRVLAEALHGQADALCRIDMNTLAQDHYSAAITGAPPGYVGSKEGTSLIDSEKVQGSYSRPGVVLFDEIEKAGPQVLRALLNVLDSGHLRLSSGTRSIDFRNSLIFMTSNIGAREWLRDDVDGVVTSASIWRRLLGRIGRSPARMQRRVMRHVEQFFDPEFVNRIDQIHLFQRLHQQRLPGLIAIELDRLNRRLAVRHLRLCLGEDAQQFLLSRYDAHYGARSMRRAFRHWVETALADYLLAPGELPAKGSVIHACVDGDKLVVSAIQQA